MLSQRRVGSDEIGDAASLHPESGAVPMNMCELKDLREAFGQFATGVTIVTTAGDGPSPVGITANSFSSVSLKPPMVLWSLAHEALSRQAFERAEYFCVHVLTASQRELSERFARRGSDKFGDVEWSWGSYSLPMLNEYVARFQCRTTHQYPIGDHTVFVGEVLEYDKKPERPLVFHSGQYALAERRMVEEMDNMLEAEQLPAACRRKKG